MTAMVAADGTRVTVRNYDGRPGFHIVGPSGRMVGPRKPPRTIAGVRAALGDAMFATLTPADGDD